MANTGDISVGSVIRYNGDLVVINDDIVFANSSKNAQLKNR